MIQATGCRISQVSHSAGFQSWLTDLAELNAHFGTPRDLLDLSNALHARGMYLMVDVVSLLHYSPTAF